MEIVLMPAARSSSADSAQRVFAPQPHVVSANHGSATILLDVESGQYYTLNEVAGEVWAQLCDGATVPDIVRAVRSEFDASVATITSDVLAILEQFEAMCLVTAR
jgi:Coenzyme PQQ synthesis protein D (PqqD)